MGRFADPQDPLFRALNSSIAFDYRLAPYDIEQSLAHARMLARTGILGEQDLTEIERGLAAVRDEIEQDRFEVREDDEDIHMAIERRLTEIVGPVDFVDKPVELARPPGPAIAVFGFYKFWEWWVSLPLAIHADGTLQAMVIGLLVFLLGLCCAKR
jgi:hypothetical protein